MLSAAIAAIAGALLAGPVSTPVAAPDTQAEFVRIYARILRAADTRTPDSATFERALASPDSRLRTAAARALAQLAPSHRADVLPRLRSLVHDRDSRVAASAVFGLGLAHDTVSLGTLAALARGDAVAASAAWSLGELGAPARDTLSALLTAASSGARPPATTVALLLAAAKMKPVDVARVLPLLRSHNTRVQWAAAYAIARQRSPVAARTLLELRTNDPAVLAEIARELTAPIVGDSLRAPALARVRTLARSGTPYVRVNALRALGTFGPDARSALAAALHDRDALVRVTAAQNVARAFAGDTAAWQDAWRADTAYQVRRALLESAAAARVDFGADSLWRASADWRLRAAALRARGGSPDSARARVVALEAARDPDGRVRAAAYALLARDSTSRDAAVQSALRSAANDPDSLARAELRDPPAPVTKPAPTNVHADAWYENVVRTRVLPAQTGHVRRAIVSTVRGPITIALFDAETPLTVDNFATLAGKRYYDGARFHRVVPGFVAQDGDPRGDGNGGPGYEIRDELTLLPYGRGAVGMALSGPDTGGSQYFLTLTPQPHLDGHYTVFGQVTSGFAAMDALVEGDLISSIRIVQ